MEIENLEQLKEVFLARANCLSGIVKLINFKQGEHENNLTFRVVFHLPDKYVDQKLYGDGGAMIYLSDLFYSDLDVLAKQIFGVQISWNNFKTIGWIIDKQVCGDGLGEGG
jgi:hypothetical protein